MCGKPKFGSDSVFEKPNRNKKIYSARPYVLVSFNCCIETKFAFKVIIFKCIFYFVNNASRKSLCKVWLFSLCSNSS